MQKSSEYYLTRILMVLAAIFIAYFGARLVGSLYYNHLTSGNSPLQDFKNQYIEKIKLETDPYELGKMGMTFLRSDQNDLALECFKKATELDPLWRDGWVWRGYTELKLNPPAGGPEMALESLKKAEEIDPIYPLTYQLLVIAYQQTGDTDSAASAQEKLVYLSKTYQK